MALVADFHHQVNDGVTLRFSSSLSDQYVVYADEDSLAEILRSLLWDAVYMTKEGSIVLTVTNLGILGMLTFAISDTGPMRTELNPRLTAIAIRRLNGFLYLDPHYKKGTRSVLNIRIA